MERIEVSTVTRQFKRTFDEGMLNELGKRTRLCQRERTEPRRVYRRLQLLRGLEHEQIKSIFPRG